MDRLQGSDDTWKQRLQRKRQELDAMTQDRNRLLEVLEQYQQQQQQQQQQETAMAMGMGAVMGGMQVQAQDGYPYMQANQPSSFQQAPPPQQQQQRQQRGQRHAAQQRQLQLFPPQQPHQQQQLQLSRGGGGGGSGAPVSAMTALLAGAPEQMGWRASGAPLAVSAANQDWPQHQQGTGGFR